ncbi:TonB-dependent receptor [Ornithobacterium rhinotracheale]|nr:TonB-dependent receptor [Ornithobacterium rhinotracheale]
MDVRLNVYNLTNEYLYSGSYYGYGNYYYYQAEAPRNWRLSIAYKF